MCIKVGKYRRIPYLLLILFGLVVVVIHLIDFGSRAPTRDSLLNINIQNLHQMGYYVRDFKREKGRPPASLDELRMFMGKGQATLDVLVKELPSKEEYRILRKPLNIGRILILGEQRDSIGMVAGMTEDGIVIKIMPDDIPYTD
jgi:hypothetical protein